MAKDHIGSLGLLKEAGQTLQYSILQGLGDGQIGMLKAEDPHPLGTENIG